MAKPDPTAKSDYSLFAKEQEVIATAETMLAQLQEVGQGVSRLAEAYRSQFREQQRMVKISDRMQLELQTANHRLGEQAQELLALNQALTKEIESRKLLEEGLRQLATTDSLTGLFTRRHFFELCQRELNRRRRSGGVISLILMDLDHFKKINDRLGHAAGDEALSRFAEVCLGNLRQTDVLGRIGGEEFAVLLPETNADKALEIAERLRTRVAKYVLHCGPNEFCITVSLGLTVIDDDQTTLDQALFRADQALYQAKAQGRDQVAVWSDR